MFPKTCVKQPDNVGQHEKTAITEACIYSISENLEYEMLSLLLGYLMKPTGRIIRKFVVAQLLFQFGYWIK